MFYTKCMKLPKNVYHSKFRATKNDHLVYVQT
uniref:Uncharacterized protein n=1 Tax=Anguilla anguilla TaxID=7936 RepID=A0A0E9SJN2_ANGAN